MSLRRYLLLVALLLCPLWAHAASCTGSAQCVSEQFAGGTGSNVTTVSIPMSPSNTAGNTDLWVAYFNCGTNMGSGSITSADTNSNSYNSQFQTQYTPVTTVGYFFGWALDIAAGANTITLTVHGHTDCQIIAGAWEYAGINPYNSGIIVNANWIPFSGFGSTSAFPINANQTWTPPSDSNLAFVVSVHDSGNSGTWSNTSGWNNAGQFNGSGAFQMAGWDATDSSAPSTINIGNTGGSSYAQATGLWFIFNRQASPPPPSKAGCNNYTGSSAPSCGFTPFAGGFAIASVIVGGGSFAVTLPTGCVPEGTATGNWVQLATYSNPGNLVAIYGAFLSATTPCSVTETPTGSWVQASIAVSEYTAARFPLEFELYNGVQYQDPTYTIPANSITGLTTIPVTGSNDTVVAAIQSNLDMAGLACSNGFTVDQNSPISENNSAAICSKQGVSTAQTTAVSDSGGNHTNWYTAVLRNSVPSSGPVQQVFCTSGSSPFTCQLHFPIDSGDAVTVTTGSINCSQTLTNDSGLVGYLLPGHGAAKVDTFLFANVGVSTPTWTMTWSACSSESLLITEWKNLATSNPFVDESVNYDHCTFSGCTSTSTTSYPVHILMPGAYTLYSPVSGINSSGTLQSNISCGAGFNIYFREPGNSNADTQLGCYEVVSPGVATAYANTPSWTTGVSGDNLALFAFSSVSYTLPHVIQTNGYGSSTGVLGFPDNVTAGSTVMVSAGTTTGPAGSWSLTNTCGGAQTLIRGGSGGDAYATWAINGVNGGSGCTVTPVSGSTQFVNIAEVGPVSAIQAGNSQTSTTTSVNTGNVTTTNSTTLLLSWGYSCCGLTTSICLLSDTSWTQTYPADGDNGAMCLYSKPVLTTGTWNNNNITSSSGTTNMAGIIVPLTLAPIVTQYPFVNLITQNELTRPAGLSIPAK